MKGIPQREYHETPNRNGHWVAGGPRPGQGGRRVALARGVEALGAIDGFHEDGAWPRAVEPREEKLEHLQKSHGVTRPSPWLGKTVGPEPWAHKHTHTNHGTQ